MQVKDLLNQRKEVRPFVKTIVESIYRVPSEWSMNTDTRSITHKSGLKIWIENRTLLGIWFGTSIDTDIFNNIEKVLIWEAVSKHKIALVDQMVKKITIPEAS